MKRISFWLLSTLSAVVLLVGFDASQHGASVTAMTPFTSSGTTGGAGASTKSSGTSGHKGSGAGTNGSGTNGSGSNGSTSGTPKTVTGSTAQTIWGPVQVQLKVSSGKITSVQILKYPNSTSTDVAIAQYALPILMRETTQAQSARISMVSGATYTSQGYLQSLQSALDQAHL